MTRTPFLPTVSSSRPAPIALDDIARRIDQLWSLEPTVPLAERADLIARLAELDAAVESLMIRASAGIDPHPSTVRSCAQQLLWLRSHWGDEAAA